MKYLILILMIAGCTTVHPNQDIKEFSRSGSFSLTTQNDSYSGDFDWIHNKNNDLIRFYGPMGITFAIIEVDKSKQITLSVHGEKFVGSSADVMKKQLGYVIPIEELNYWFNGLVDDRYASIKISEDQFCQINWCIQYLQYYNNLPQVIKISNETLTMKIFINI